MDFPPRRISMYSFARTAVPLATIIIALTATAAGRSPCQARQVNEPSGSISGRVTLADKPVPRVTVLLASAENGPIEKPAAKATTDEDGRFRLTNVPAGRYLVQAFAPAFVGSTDAGSSRPAKAINLEEAESVEGIDIALTRGGVITGRVTDAGGQPLVQEGIRLIGLDERGQKRPVSLPYSFMFSTDDRGVYRLFGVPPGRYVVSAGVDTNAGYVRTGFGISYYALTYHPDATDQSKATIIEVTSGGETTGIDITLGRPAKSYAASGRIVDVDTGKPIAGMRYGYGSLQPGRNSFGYATSGYTSNSRGEFRLEGIVPGHYAAFASSMEESDSYSDPALFQVTDGDVAGLEIKVHRGSSLSGVVAIEGASDQESAPKLSDVPLDVSVYSEPVTAPRSHTINVGPDGSFRATGLPPGKANFFISQYPAPKGLSLLRVERDGVEQQGGVEISAGEQVFGVKVVLGYGTGVIRAQVKTEGGVLPAGARLFADLRRIGSSEGTNIKQPAFPDSRGRFVFEGLLPGEYEVSLTAMAMPVPGAPQPRPKFAKQTVSVINGTEAQVVLVIDLNEKKQ
jgi:protocatechuate 3,4-dioxygenase beta subunit